MFGGECRGESELGAVATRWLAALGATGWWSAKRAVWMGKCERWGGDNVVIYHGYESGGPDELRRRHIFREALA